LFGNVLAAVAHAHNHLVIHSDIKPSNILVSVEGTVKLLDFGIAKLLREESDDVTVLGYRALTPEYAAPEQLLGGEISTATDVYSLGVLLYQLLSGRHPTAPQIKLPASAVQALVHGQSPRLSHGLLSNDAAQDRPATEIAQERGTTVPRLRRRLQGDLENIVAQALQKEAPRRYPTVAALAEDLQRHLTHRPVQARAESWLYRSGKFLRRQRGSVLASAIVLLAVMAGVAGTITQARRAQREADNARHQLIAAESKSELFNFLASEGFGRFTPMAQVLERAESVVQHQFASDPDTMARLNLQLSALQVTAGNPQRALALRWQARELVHELPDMSLHAEIDCAIAQQLRSRGRYAEARALYDPAIANLRKLRTPEDATVLPWCLVERSWLNAQQANPHAALDDAQAAFANLATPRPDQRMLEVQVKEALANAWSLTGERVAAAREYRAALTELEQLGRAATSNAPWTLLNLGTVLFEIGDVAAAGELFDKAQRIETGSSDPYLYTFNGFLGRQLMEIGRTAQAITLLDQARRGAQAAGDAPSASIYELYAAIARCGPDRTACAAELTQARTAMAKSLPAGNSRFAILEMANARLELARGNPARARALLEQALAILTAANEHGQYLIKTLALLAHTELQLSESVKARAHAVDAVSQAHTLMQGFEHSAWLGEALLTLGLVQQAEGNRVQAHASWRAAQAELQAALADSAPRTSEVRALLEH
jgi:serine/threonine-protein kinase